MKSFAFFTYYALLVLIIFLFLLFGDFSLLTTSVRLTIFVLLAFAIIGPPLLLKVVGKISSSSHRANRELRQENTHLQQINKEQSQMISLTTHQLRTPLSAIKWTFHMLLGGELGAVTEDQKHFLQKGYDSAERVITIINDWLNLDYVEANKNSYKFVAIDLVELVNRIVSELKPRLEEKSLSLDIVEPLKSPLLVEVDPIKISMVVENLLDNAIKYTPNGGTVTIAFNDDKINATDGEIEFTVQDNGIGIPLADRPRIFTRSFRSMNAAGKSTQGSGLGLYIVKGIVEKHHGRIWFDCGKGGGTSFHVAIPIKQKKDYN